jgi:hypothetical protein
LLASKKLWTELSAVDAAEVTATICPAEGFDVSALTALESEATEDLTALVSFGKSLLACVTTLSAAVLTFSNCVCKVLTLLLGLRLVTPLIESWSSARAEQYAGLLALVLLLPQPASATSATTATETIHRVAG